MTAWTWGSQASVGTVERQPRIWASEVSHVSHAVGRRAEEDAYAPLECIAALFSAQAVTSRSAVGVAAYTWHRKARMTRWTRLQTGLEPRV